MTRFTMSVGSVCEDGKIESERERSERSWMNCKKIDSILIT